MDIIHHYRQCILLGTGNAWLPTCCIGHSIVEPTVFLASCMLQPSWLECCFLLSRHCLCQILTICHFGKVPHTNMQILDRFWCFKVFRSLNCFSIVSELNNWCWTSCCYCCWSRFQCGHWELLMCYKIFCLWHCCNWGVIR